MKFEIYHSNELHGVVPCDRGWTLDLSKIELDFWPLLLCTKVNAAFHPSVVG